MVEYCLARSFENNINLNGRAIVKPTKQPTEPKETIVVEQIRNIRKEIHFILLLGSNAAGKAKKGRALCLLTEHLGTYRIVMSALIKKHRRKKTPLGALFDKEQAIEDDGGLLMDAPIFSAFEEEVLLIHKRHKDNKRKGVCTIILDGFPRKPAQLKRFMSYLVTFAVYYLEIDLATCLARVAHRAATEGPRKDDKKAAGRFKLLTHNIEQMLRIIKKGNKNAVTTIDACATVREQLTRILKASFEPFEVREMMKCLDNPAHRVRILIDKIEGKKPHRGGASAHSVPRSLSSLASASTGGGDARELVTP